MQSYFVFITDSESYDFCMEICEIMVKDFGISLEEAIFRINRRWKLIPEINKDDIIFHETPEFWAYDIYYGHDSRWWARMCDKELTPLKID